MGPRGSLTAVVKISTENTVNRKTDNLNVDTRIFAMPERLIVTTATGELIVCTVILRVSSRPSSTSHLSHLAVLVRQLGNGWKGGTASFNLCHRLRDMRTRNKNVLKMSTFPVYFGGVTFDIAWHVVRL